ncbi:hypothetical protein [Hymenobacter sp.]|uniref:hypothetical protein n=1 Tax=Hymenobacter sp. TaxID=1898978 RepID=UPI00286A1B5B|nr:hypothetical protein [Hymenobacter sp.]
MKLAFAALAAALLPAAPAARAQDLPIPDYTIANQGRIGTLITQGVIDRHQGKKEHQSSGYVVGRPGSRPPTTAGTRPAGAAAATAAVNLTYAPTVAQRQHTVQQYADDLRAANPTAARTIAASFGPGQPADYTALYQQLLQGTGLPTNDVGTALAALLVTGWQIVGANQQRLSLRGPEVRAVRAQLLPLLGPALRTEAAPAGENFKLQTVLLTAGWQGAVQKNTAPAFQQKIAALFQTRYHFDLAQSQLTAEGFAKK